MTALRPARIVESSLPAFSPLLRDFRAFLAGQHRDEAFLRRGDHPLLGGGVSAEVLYPPGDLPGKLRTAADRALALRLDAPGWRVLVLNEGDGAAARWLLAHETPENLASAVLVTAAPVAPPLLAAVRPRLLVLRPPVVRDAVGGQVASPVSPAAPLPRDLAVFDQRESGAATLRLYPDHLEADGFADGRRITLPR